jgi:hypothetical protein
MKLRGVMVCVLLASCGGEDDIDPKEMMMMTNAAGLEIGGKIFELPEAPVFVINGAFDLEIGALTGDPLTGTFRIKSRANSDEATGTLSTKSPCQFNVVESSFPGNALVQAGAMLSAECAYDKATAVLRLGTTNSIACILPDEAGECVPGSGG